MTRAKLKRISALMSGVAWLFFACVCVLTMTEGGLAAAASLFMLVVFSLILLVDFVATRELDHPRGGCLPKLYFAQWGFLGILCALSMCSVPFSPEIGVKATGWTALLLAAIYAVATAFAVVKLLIGRRLRRRGGSPTGYSR